MRRLSSIHFPSRRKVWLWAAVIVCGLFVLLFSPWFFRREMPPAVPAQIENFDPQLRAHLARVIAVVQKAPWDWERHAALGMAYAANSLWAEAKQQFENTVTLKPSEPLALMYRGVAELELNQLDVALNTFRELVGRFPGFPQGHYRLGEAALRKGNYVEAEAAFQKLTELAPQEWRGFTGLAEVKLHQAKPAEAIPLLEKALAIDPSCKKAHHLLGTALRAVGETSRAEMELALGADLQDFPMPDPWSEQATFHMKSLPTQLEMAKEFIEQGQPANAVMLLSEAYRFQSNNVTLLNNLAIAHNSMGRPDQALPLLEQALKLDSNYVPARITLSHSYHLMEKHAEALKEADAAITSSPDLMQAYLARANALLGAERDREAIQALERAAELDPRNGQIMLEIGDIHFRNLQNPTGALIWYSNAVQSSPALAIGWWKLAEIQKELGQLDEAKKNEEKAVQLGRVQGFNISSE